MTPKTAGLWTRQKMSISRDPWAIKVSDCPILTVLFSRLGIFFFVLVIITSWVFQVALVVKNLPANARDATDVGLIPGLGRAPGGGGGNPLLYSCLENSMDRGAWRATVPRPTELDTTERLSTHACIITSYIWGLSDNHQFSSVAQSCLTLCNPMDCSMPGLPVHYQLLEPTQTHAHWVGDAIQPSDPLSSPSSLAFNLSQHQGLFKWVSSSHQVAKVLQFWL